MIDIIVITAITPTKENVNGPSALLYHLLKSRSKGLSTEIYTLNTNHVENDMIMAVEKDLMATSRVMKKSFYNMIITNHIVNRIMSIFFPQIMPEMSHYHLPAHSIKEIRGKTPKFVWIYPHYLIGVANQLKDMRLLVTGPDSSSLHFSRVLRDRYVFVNRKEIFTMKDYLGSIKLERKWGEASSVNMHLVGIADTKYFNLISESKKAFFIPHPHYNLNEKEINFEKEKLSILISGKEDVYTYSDINRLVEILCVDENNEIKNNFIFTFLGKGLARVSMLLNQSGYTTNHINWVDEYIEFLKYFDVQILPISVGSGTKGKALDALGAGILCIGSKYAFENIAVKDMESCLLYDDVIEVPHLLTWILKNRMSAKEICTKGKMNIRKYHNPALIMGNIERLMSGQEINIDESIYYHSSY